MKIGLLDIAISSEAPCHQRTRANRERQQHCRRSSFFVAALKAQTQSTLGTRNDKRSTCQLQTGPVLISASSNSSSSSRRFVVECSSGTMRAILGPPICIDLHTSTTHQTAPVVDGKARGTSCSPFVPRTCHCHHSLGLIKRRQ